MKWDCKVFLWFAAILASVAFGAENTAPVIVSAPYAVPAALNGPGSTDLCVLAGDDQLPAGVLTYTWTKVSGPGDAAFGANNGGSGGATCSVNLSASGSYRFAVSVSDGALSTTGEVAVEVAAPAEAAGREAGIGVPLETYVSIFAADDSTLTCYEPGEVGLDLFVNRSGDFTNALNVIIRITGTAIANTDYVFTGPAYSSSPTLLVVTIPAGEPLAVFSIKPKADTIADNNETINLSIIPLNTVYLVTGTSNSIAAKISELPLIKVRTRAHAAEGGPAGNFEFIRSGGTGPFTVRYSLSGSATNGSDYQGLLGTATFLSGQNTVNHFAFPINDTLRETTETIKLTLLPDSRYAIDPYGASDTVKLRDNDNPTVIVFDVNNEASEPGTNTGGVTFKRFGNLSGALTINYTVSGSATNGVDYVSLSKKVTFAAGSDLASIQIKVKDDTLREGDEDVVIKPAAGTGYQIEAGDNAYIWIIDND